MKVYKKQIYLLFFISLLIVSVSFTFLFINFQKQIRMQNEILRFEKNTILSDSLNNNLLKIESGKRGFQLTHDSNYLNDIVILKENINNNIAGLEKEMSKTDHEQTILKIDSLLKLRIANLDSGITVFISRGFNAATEFMQLKDKKNIRDLLNQELVALRSDFQNQLRTNAANINKKSNQNMMDLLILLLIFIVSMITTTIAFRRSQQKIIKNQIKFKEAQRIAKIGSWEWDIVSNKITWSSEQYRLFGENSKTFIPTCEGYLEHLSETEKKKAKVLLKDALEGVAKYAIEHEIIRKDGTTLMVFEQGSVLHDENNRPIRMIGTTQDITDRKKTENDLLDAQRKLQSIFENTADGIYQSTEEGRFLTANPAMAKIFGYDSATEFISSIADIGVQLYVHKEDRKKMADLLLKYGHLENYEVPLFGKNGSIVWVSESTRVVRGENGNILYYEGTLKDITERKRVEESLGAMQKRYQAIFDNTTVGIYQSTLDGKFIMANSSMARIFGYDSPAHLIRSVTNISSQIFADPEVRKQMIEMLSLYDHIENFELQALSKNKNVIWVNANIRAVRDEKGEINYFEGILEDITERKKADEQLIVLSNRLQLAIKATGIGIWDWDIVNDNTEWDDEMYRIYDVDPSDVKTITESWTDALHPDDLERINAELKTAVTGEKEFDTEFRVVWKNKSIHHIKANSIVLKDNMGKPVRMIGTNADITKRKEAEEEILQLNRSLDQFANITAHDLQEPIRMVSGFLGLLEKRYNNVLDEQGRSYVFRAKDGADRMTILIRDLLEFSRSGNKAAKKEPVELDKVMDLVKKDLSIVVSDTGATIDIPPSLPVVTGTSSALYRLFLNLISNGIKFRKKNTAPEIKLCMKELSDDWEFTLQDNGIGVAEKDQPRLFQAFQRLHRKEDYPGTGLGLVTCKKIVETHGGKIWMTSELGKGTAFHFTLHKNGHVNGKELNHH